jgi:hypothetical protein
VTAALARCANWPNMGGARAHFGLISAWCCVK